MKVLLVATNQADRFMDRMVVRPVPIGLAYLAASVDEERHTLRVLDLMFAEDAVSEVADAVSDFEPDLIGLSIRNLDNQSSLNPVWNLPAVRDIIERIRQISSAKTLIGGPAFSIMPSECLDYVSADLGIAGDAAEAFATLVERLDTGGDYRDIPGIVYRDDANGGEIVVSEGRFTSSFHRAPRLDL
ncbi:MAG: cobalamin-dependent protein, partial [Dehalococcoidia bacterium]|nr:cobalamin-dependent protein [Dehalococcoidia bacterium]